VNTASALEAVRSLWDPILALAAGVDDQDWSRPTPCGDWDVKDLLGHVSGLQRFFDAGVHLPAPDGWAAPEGTSPLDAFTAEFAAARAGWEPDQVLAELEEARAGHRQRAESVGDWSAPTQGPLGETTEEGLLRTRAFDLWVHLQDLRMALDAGADVTDASAGAVLAYEYVIGLVPYVAARRVALPDGSAVRLRLRTPHELDRIVRITDRRGAWEEPSSPGDADVEAAPGALVLLLAGRGDPAGWHGDGHLDWRGDVGRDFVERGRLF
jgi:uncharacterized protein (TIGR03083 family)